MAADTEQEKFDKHRTAGKILAEVRAEAVKKVKVGVSLLETAEFVENLIRRFPATYPGTTRQRMRRRL